MFWIGEVAASCQPSRRRSLSTANSTRSDPIPSGSFQASSNRITVASAAPIACQMLLPGAHQAIRDPGRTNWSLANRAPARARSTSITGAGR
jgi:hypothetical protein